MPLRLFIWVGLALSLSCVAYIAMIPGFHFNTDMDEFRRQCMGDGECVQKLEAQRKLNSDAEINFYIKAAIARRDEQRRQSRSN